MEENTCIKTGVDELDQLLKGGLPKNTSTLFLSPKDTDFDDLLVNIVENHLENKMDYICISLLCPPMFEDTIKDYSNFKLLCSELGTFRYLGEAENMILSEPQAENIEKKIDELITASENIENTIVLINISSIQFYHGLIPTKRILKKIISILRDNELASIIGYLEINERSSPSLDDIENIFEGCIQLLHAKLDKETKKFLYVKKMKNISANYELIPIIFEE